MNFMYKQIVSIDSHESQGMMSHVKCIACKSFRAKLDFERKVAEEYVNHNVINSICS